MAAATFAGTTKAVAAEFCVEPVISNSGTEAVACRSRRKEYKAAEEWEEVRGGGGRTLLRYPFERHFLHAPRLD